MKTVPLAEPLASAKLRELRDYWLSARGERRMPSRRDIDPIAIPKLLPFIVLTDVLQDPLRFRYRLIGTAITALTGRDVTGLWLDEELYGDNLERMTWSFRTCAETMAPVAARQKAQFPDRDWVTVEVLLLPLGDRDDTVEVIISGLNVLDKDATQPPPDCRYLLDWQSDP